MLFISRKKKFNAMSVEKALNKQNARIVSVTKYRKYGIWLPPALSATFAAVTLVFYTSLDDASSLTVAKIVIAAFIPIVIPFYELIFKRKISIFANILVASHAVLSVFLGSGFAFYSRIAWWDLFLHGYFGLVGAALLFTLFTELGGKIPRVGLCVFIFLSVMGCAALWEIFEFTTDRIFAQDAQCVYEAMRNGKNPVSDTMTDIIITAPGAVIFLVLTLFRKNDKKRQKN